MWIDTEMRRVDVGAATGEQNTVDGIQQGADVGHLGHAGKHQRQRTGDIGHRAQITLAGCLHGMAALDLARCRDYADDGFAHDALAIAISGRGRRIPSVRALRRGSAVASRN